MGTLSATPPRRDGRRVHRAGGSGALRPTWGRFPPHLRAATAGGSTGRGFRRVASHMGTPHATRRRRDQPPCPPRERGPASCVPHRDASRHTPAPRRPPRPPRERTVVAGVRRVASHIGTLHATRPRRDRRPSRRRGSGALRPTSGRFTPHVRAATAWPSPPRGSGELRPTPGRFTPHVRATTAWPSPPRGSGELRPTRGRFTPHVRAAPAAYAGIGRIPRVRTPAGFAGIGRIPRVRTRDELRGAPRSHRTYRRPPRGSR